MTRIFRLYFTRSLPGLGAGLAAALLSMPLLSGLKMFQDTAVLLFFWVTMALPAAAVLIGAMIGAETAEEARAEAEGALPVSAFGRLTGAALAALAGVTLVSAVMLAVSGELKHGEIFIFGGPNLGSVAYLAALLMACAYSFVFGRLSRSLMAGAAAGGTLALVTALGIMSSVAVDAWVIGDNRATPFKIAMQAVAAFCAVLSLKYISRLTERKERASAATVLPSALLLAAGLLLAGLLLGASKSAAHRLLVRQDFGDGGMAGALLLRENRDGAYKVYENPVKEELVLVGPDASPRVIMPGRTKTLPEFFRKPMNFSVAAALALDDGSAWVITREPEHPIYYAPPGGQLREAGRLGKGSPRFVLFPVDGKPWLAMSEYYGDGANYLARLEPGRPVKPGFSGKTKLEGREAVIKLKKASGRYAWLSKDRRSLLTMAGGRETEACRLPYKGAAFFHSPVYEAVRAGKRDLFFVPLLKDGKTALHYCERGKAAAPAWDGPEGYMFEFKVSHDGSAYTTYSRLENGKNVDKVYYVINSAGEMLPPIKAEDIDAGTAPDQARPVKAEGREVFFVHASRGLLRTDGKSVAAETGLAGQRKDVTAVRDGVLFRTRGGLQLAGWDGKKRTLY